MNAAALVCSASPDAIVTTFVSCGGVPPAVDRVSRRTVPRWTTPPAAATVPLRTLVTNRSDREPELTAVASHGPLMPWPAIVSRTWPWGPRTIRQPARAVAAWPLADGVLPTTTQPPGSTASAVLRPTPPGQAPGRGPEMLAKTERWPPGLISTSVRPVPCSLALSLKLLTRMSPACSRPTLWLSTTMPYGLTSPLGGTVEAMVASWWNWPMND